MCKFRLLNADEIETRVATVNDKGVSLLLYKDARADMTILDETVGAENWQRRHVRDNANCIVSIWDEKKSQWIEKEDTGTESNTEKEKGLASDSFKRACTNWGIGRELYTAPFIWIPANKIEWTTKNGKQVPKTRFKVCSIEYDEKRRINGLEIISDNNEVVFKFGGKASNKKQDIPPLQVKASTYEKLMSEVRRTGVRTADIGKKYNVSNLSMLTEEQAQEVIEKLATKPTMNAGAGNA